jgi:hypothetical protein
MEAEDGAICGGDFYCNVGPSSLYVRAVREILFQ